MPWLKSLNYPVLALTVLGLAGAVALLGGVFYGVGRVLIRGKKKLSFGMALILALAVIVVGLIARLG